LAGQSNADLRARPAFRTNQAPQIPTNGFLPKNASLNVRRYHRWFVEYDRLLLNPADVHSCNTRGGTLKNADLKVAHQLPGGGWGACGPTDIELVGSKRRTAR